MKAFLSEHEAGAAILDVGRRVYQSGLVAANDGNLSCRLADGTILVTPTGVSKGFMTEDMLVRMDLNGNVLGDGRPSSEVKMHLRVYQENPELGGVVHVHPPVATGCSIIGLELTRPVVAEAVLVTGNIPIAPYAKPGTFAVPESIAPFVNQYHGVLLENHGALTWGEDLYQALYRMEAIEHQAKIMMYASLMGALYKKELRHFTQEELDGLVGIRTGWGVTTGGRPEA